MAMDWGRVGRGVNWEVVSDTHTLTAVCTMDSWWEAAVGHRALSSVLCDDPEEWGEKSKREGMCVYLQLIHAVTQQKLTL